MISSHADRVPQDIRLSSCFYLCDLYARCQPFYASARERSRQLKERFDFGVKAVEAKNRAHESKEKEGKPVPTPSFCHLRVVQSLLEKMAKETEAYKEQLQSLSKREEKWKGIACFLLFLFN